MVLSHCSNCCAMTETTSTDCCVRCGKRKWETQVDDSERAGRARMWMSSSVMTVSADGRLAWQVLS